MKRTDDEVMKTILRGKYELIRDRLMLKSYINNLEFVLLVLENAEDCFIIHDKNSMLKILDDIIFQTEKIHSLLTCLRQAVEHWYNLNDEARKKYLKEIGLSELVIDNNIFKEGDTK